VLQDTLNQDTPDILEKYELLPGQIVKMAAVMLSVIPVLLVYPWLQKYFAKGVMLGSVKG
jgi:putative aldouronate transport system permease protein